jgi:hypothetical protein
MTRLVQTADSKGRVALPGFANATLLFERIDDTEYRVRKMPITSEKEPRFHEEDFPVQLSERDARRIMAALAKPPASVAAARRAAKRFRKKFPESGN